jgi:hypothetical protein
MLTLSAHPISSVFFPPEEERITVLQASQQTMAQWIIRWNDLLDGVLCDQREKGHFKFYRDLSPTQRATFEPIPGVEYGGMKLYSPRGSAMAESVEALEKFVDQLTALYGGITSHDGPTHQCVVNQLQTLSREAQADLAIDVYLNSLPPSRRRQWLQEWEQALTKSYQALEALAATRPSHLSLWWERMTQFIQMSLKYGKRWYDKLQAIEGEAVREKLPWIDRKALRDRWGPNKIKQLYAPLGAIEMTRLCRTLAAFKRLPTRQRGFPSSI